jgi:hypothetical protein
MRHETLKPCRHTADAIRYPRHRHYRALPERVNLIHVAIQFHSPTAFPRASQGEPRWCTGHTLDSPRNRRSSQLMLEAYLLEKLGVYVGVKRGE